MYALEIGTVYLQMKTMLKIVFFAGDKNEILELAESSYIYKYILFFCSHSLVFKCQPDCSNQDQHFFLIPACFLVNPEEIPIIHKVAVIQKALLSKYPGTSHVSASRQRFLYAALKHHSVLFSIVCRLVPEFFDFFFLNLSVFYAWALFFCEHLSIWHSRGVVLLMRPGDYVLPGDALIPVSHIQHRRLLSG